MKGNYKFICQKLMFFRYFIIRNSQSNRIKFPDKEYYSIAVQYVLLKSKMNYKEIVGMFFVVLLT